MPKTQIAATSESPKPDLSNHLVAPDGTYIVGTLERVYGSATLHSLRRSDNGNVIFEHAGETEIDWDSQETVLLDGQTIFLDESGNQWPADSLVLAPELRAARATADSSAPELAAILRRLLEWADATGGWEAECWRDAKRILEGA